MFDEEFNDDTEFDLLGQTEVIPHDNPLESEDDEGAMMKADLYKLAKYSYKLFQKINDNDQFESWVQAKVTKAADYLSSVYHYLEYEKEFSEYGKKLEDSDIYSESEKKMLKNKLMEARKKVSELKKAQATKADTCKITKSKKSKEELDEKTDCKVKTNKSKKELDEKAKPSAGMTKKEKSAVVKKAKAGEDIGKPGKNFKKVVASAKKSGAKDPQAVAAAAMWKNAKKAIKEGFEQPIVDDPDIEEAFERDFSKNQSFETSIILNGEDVNVKVEYEILGSDESEHQNKDGSWEPPQHSQTDIISVTNLDTGEPIEVTPEIEDQLIDEINNLDHDDWNPDWDEPDPLGKDDWEKQDSFDIDEPDDHPLRESTNLNSILKLAGVKQLNG